MLAKLARCPVPVGWFPLKKVATCRTGIWCYACFLAGLNLLERICLMMASWRTVRGFLGLEFFKWFFPGKKKQKVIWNCWKYWSGDGMWLKCCEKRKLYADLLTSWRNGSKSLPVHFWRQVPIRRVVQRSWTNTASNKKLHARMDSRCVCYRSPLWVLQRWVKAPPVLWCLYRGHSSQTLHLQKLFQWLSVSLKRAGSR